MTPAERDQVDVYVDAIELGPAQAVGALAREGTGERAVTSFSYRPQWLSAPSGFPVDPGLGQFEGDQFLPALPGVLQDAAPDRWGRTLMERREALMARREGRPVRTLDEWDFLLGVDDATRQGALRVTRDGETFLAKSELPVPPVTRLRELEELVRRHEADELADRASEDRWLELLVEPGSSLGGARPKASFRDLDGALWLAKFPSQNDRRDVGRWEHVLCELAAEAGIATPETRLIQLGGGHGTFCSRRFDRSKRGDRRLYASAMTLTGHTDGEEGASYLDIAQAIEMYGPDRAIAEDLEQLFRRLVFNVISGNRDDHLRNHGFIRHRDGWRLSPAFDVNPDPGRRTHSLAIDGDHHEADLDLVRETAGYYRLSPPRTEALIREVSDALAGWRDRAKRKGIGADEIELMAPAFLV